MTQEFRARADLPDDMIGVPSIHMLAQIHLQLPVSEDLTPSPRLHEYQICTQCKYIHAFKILIHIKNLKIVCFECYTVCQSNYVHGVTQ